LFNVQFFFKPVSRVIKFFNIVFSPVFYMLPFRFHVSKTKAAALPSV